MERAKLLKQKIDENEKLIEMIGDCGYIHFDIGNGEIKLSIGKSDKHKIDTPVSKCYDILEH